MNDTNVSLTHLNSIRNDNEKCKYHIDLSKTILKMTLPQINVIHFNYIKISISVYK